MASQDARLSLDVRLHDAINRQHASARARRVILVSGCNQCSVETVEDQSLVVAATVVDAMNLNLIVGD